MRLVVCPCLFPISICHDVYPKAILGLALENIHVVCGSGPGITRPHNCCFVLHCSQKQPQLGRTAAVESNSSIHFKCSFRSCLELGVQLKSQDRCRVVMSVAFMWQCKVLAQCAASASHSSAETASSGTQHLAQKLDCVRGKSQLFHMTTMTFQNDEIMKIHNFMC